ncbi:MAG: hypothetical protein HY861_04970 [Chlamydiia bacterium]|nr:hypothetical protein [Chlamydiia bacterium]
MKLWIYCLLGACALAALFAKCELERSAFLTEAGVFYSRKIDRSLAALYHAGKSGKISFSPQTGYATSWNLPQKRLAPPKKMTPGDAVTYGFSGGRLGDNLLAYLHAQWISYQEQMPLVFKPFPMAEEFAFSHQIHIDSVYNIHEIPYFPEPSIKDPSPPFTVDWEDPKFREIITASLAPTQGHTPIPLPPDRISLCVHIRRTGAVDSYSAQPLHPLKFLPDRYYIEQIRRISRLFRGQPLYVFLMTDDLAPQQMLQRYKQALPLKNIQWECRTDTADHTFDDFFSIPRFDCLIRSDSNFSFVASKLSEYAVEITPTHYQKKKGSVRITGSQITFNPSYKKVHARKEKILIGGVCRNTANTVSNVIRNAQSLGNRFADYAVLIYENNSTDNTAPLFSQWVKDNPHVVFVSETVQKLPPSRTERISRARNAVLSLARAPKYADFKYFVIVDLDFSTPWPIERIVQTIERGGDWDCIAANGIDPNGAYYDRYAHRDTKRPFGPELLGEWWRTQVMKTPVFFPSKERGLIPVFSAFGGLAIYKTASILPFHYSGTVTRDLQEYYTRILHKTWGSSHPQLDEYLRQLGLQKTSRLKHKSIPIIFVENMAEEHPEGFRHPTCCEHVPLHASMTLHGHGKIFIDPEMILIRDLSK